MKTSVIFCALCASVLIMCTQLFAQNYHSGDLIFVSSENSEFEKAIATSTKTENNVLNFNHVGIINVTDTGVFVIEAVPQKGVVYTNLQTFKEENKNGIWVVATLLPEYQKYTKHAIARACSHLGKGYDYAFDFNNDLYYCSELVYDAYVHATGNPHFFETPDMTFKKEETDEILPYWLDYFEKLNLPVPEGKPGINPNGLYNSLKLKK